MQIIQLANGNPPQQILVGSDALKQCIYLGNQTVYKVNQVIEGDILDAMTQDLVVDYSNNVRMYLEKNEIETYVEVCEEIEEFKDQNIIWFDGLQWKKDNIENYDWDWYYYFFNGSNWKKLEVAELIEEIPDDLDWISLDIHDGNNLTYCGSNTLRGSIVTLNHRYYLKESSLYQGSHTDIFIFQEFELIEWAKNENFPITDFIELEGQKLKDKLKEELERMDKKYGVSEHNSEFELNGTDGIILTKSRWLNDFECDRFYNELAYADELTGQILEWCPEFDLTF